MSLIIRPPQPLLVLPGRVLGVQAAANDVLTSGQSLHRVLKTTLSVSGSDLPTALLEHVQTNDSTMLEASDKVQLPLINTRKHNYNYYLYYKYFVGSSVQ